MNTPEYCFLWIDWWPACMTKSEWAGWMQAAFSVVAILASVLLLFLQQHIQHKREERTAKAAILPFAGAVVALTAKHLKEQPRTYWDLRMTLLALEAELERANAIPLQALDLSWQRAVYLLRINAQKIIATLRLLDKTPDHPEDGLSVDSYRFLQKVARGTELGVVEALKLLGLDTEIALSKYKS